MSDCVTWGELKAWLEEKGIKDDDLIGFWDFWWPKNVGAMKLWRGTTADGTGPEAVHVEDV